MPNNFYVYQLIYKCSYLLYKNISIFCVYYYLLNRKNQRTSFLNSKDISEGLKKIGAN